MKTKRLGRRQRARALEEAAEAGSSSGIVGDAPTIQELSRRRLLGGLAGFVSGGVAASSALAQDKWYERIFNNTTSEDPRRRPRGARKPVKLDDLRKSPIPLRSDEMLANIDRVIAHYRSVVAKGGWPTTKTLRLLRPGEDNEAIPAIRKQLIITGDIPQKGANYYGGSYNFDDWLEFGVKRFQQRHGLRVSGRLDRPTRAQLAVSADARLSQLMLNRRRIVRLLEGASEER
ncbi:MAG: peptidoglycan-binding protein, partial [Hyphomicrobiaceae bacterium]